MVSVYINCEEHDTRPAWYYHTGRMHLLEASLRRLPIDYIPDSTEIFRFAILILEAGGSLVTLISNAEFRI